LADNSSDTEPRNTEQTSTQSYTLTHADSGRNSALQNNQRLGRLIGMNLARASGIALDTENTENGDEGGEEETSVNVSVGMEVEGEDNADNEESVVVEFPEQNFDDVGSMADNINVPDTFELHFGNSDRNSGTSNRGGSGGLETRPVHLLPVQFPVDESCWPTHRILPENDVTFEEFIENQVQNGLEYVHERENAEETAKDFVPFQDRVVTSVWTVAQIICLWFWFDIDALLISAKKMTHILESIGRANSPFLVLSSCLDFVSVKTISHRLLGRKPGGAKFKNPFTGQESSLSDLSSNPCVCVARMNTQPHSIPMNVYLILLDEKARKGTGQSRWTREQKWVVSVYFEIVRSTMGTLPHHNASVKDRSGTQAWYRYPISKETNISQKYTKRVAGNTTEIDQAHTFFRLWEDMMPNIEMFIKQSENMECLTQKQRDACKHLRNNHFFLCAGAGEKFRLAGEIRLDPTTLSGHHSTIGNSSCEIFKGVYYSIDICWCTLPFSIVKYQSNYS
jgi:hypothetical protein